MKRVLSLVLTLVVGALAIPLSAQISGGNIYGTVTDQSGERVDKNNATVGEGNKKLQIDLEDLESGAYTVDWKTLATDQHTMKGKFTFKVAIV